MLGSLGLSACNPKTPSCAATLRSSHRRAVLVRRLSPSLGSRFAPLAFVLLLCSVPCECVVRRCRRRCRRAVLVRRLSPSLCSRFAPLAFVLLRCSVPCECVALAAVDGDAVGRCSCVGCRRCCALASLRSRSCCPSSISPTPLSGVSVTKETCNATWCGACGRTSCQEVSCSVVFAWACVLFRHSTHCVCCRR